MKDGSGKSYSHKTKKSNVIPFKRKRKYKNFATTILLAIVVICVGLFTPLFNISMIEVSGNQKFTREQVANMSGIPIGQNIFRVNYFRAKSNLLSNPYIDKANISRRYPSRVQINIMERKPAAYIQYMGANTIIDKDGTILETTNSLDSVKGLPNIIGIKLKDCKTNTHINAIDEDKEKVQPAIDCLNQIIKSSLFEAVNKIDVSNLNKMTVTAYADTLQINLIDGKNIERKFAFVSEILPNLEQDKNLKGVIDFTDVNKPVFRPNY